MKLIIEDLFIKNKGLYGYRPLSNKNGLVKGIKLVKEQEKNDADKIICFEVEWDNNTVYIPVGDIDKSVYELTEKEE